MADKQNIKGHDGSYQLLDISHTREELVQRLQAVTAACGADWDFDGEGVSKEDAQRNLGLIASCEAAYAALLRDEAKMDGTTAGIGPGSGRKQVIDDTIVGEIADLWNANCPEKYKKLKPLVGIYLDEKETPTGGII